MGLRMLQTGRTGTTGNELSCQTVSQSESSLGNLSSARQSLNWVRILLRSKHYRACLRQGRRRGPERGQTGRGVLRYSEERSVDLALTSQQRESERERDREKERESIEDSTGPHGTRLAH
ncbi:hypothetical protein MHYP_G00291250 [Metynnis hypsauchen]